MEKYNKLAPLQNPPRPVLDYSEVVGYASLGEFSLLKYSRHDILAKPWSIPANREMAMKYFKLVRSREEIIRLNVEIKRLQSWVEHEDQSILKAINSLFADDQNSLLIDELKAFYAKCCRINDKHCKILQKIYVLDGYTGEHLSQTFDSVMPDEDGIEEGDLEYHEDAVNDEAVRLEDLMSHLTL